MKFLQAVYYKRDRTKNKKETGKGVEKGKMGE